MVGTLEAMRRRAQSMRVCRESSWRIQIEDQDIAAPGRNQRFHPLSVGLEQNLEIFTKGRRKKRLQRSVFGIQSNSCHVPTVIQLTAFTVPLWELGDVTS